VEFAAKARSAAVVLACKLPFHAPFIGDEKAFATFNIQVDATIAVLEVSAPVQDAVSQEIQGHGVSQRRAKRFDDIKSEGRTSVGRLVKKSDSWIQSDSMQASFRLGD
jgi:hypothetical protein